MKLSGISKILFILITSAFEDVFAFHIIDTFGGHAAPAVAKMKSVETDISSADGATKSRRRFLIDSAFATSAALSFMPTPPAFAASSGYSLYNDPVHGFSIEVPSEWVQSTQELPDRRKIQVWTDPADPKTLLFIAYTPVRDDFTSLASFGSVDQVAAQTILPKGEIAGEDVKANMLSASSKNQAYYFDYTQEVPGVQPETHMRVIFALQQGATGGAGAVLVTATAQAPQERYEKYEVKSIFDHVINSYGKSVVA